MEELSRIAGTSRARVAAHFLAKKEQNPFEYPNLWRFGNSTVALKKSEPLKTIAARLAYHDLGEFVDSEDVTTERLLQLISAVLQDPGYRGRARFFQKLIDDTNGLNLAANHLEKAFHS